MSLPFRALVKVTVHRPAALRVTVTLPTPMPGRPSRAVRIASALASSDSGAVVAAPRLMAKLPDVVDRRSRRCTSDVVAPVRVVVREAAGARTGSTTPSMTGMVWPSAAPPNATRHCCAALSSVTVTSPPKDAKLLLAALVAFSRALRTVSGAACRSKAAVVKVAPLNSNARVKVPDSSAPKVSMRCTAPVACPPMAVWARL